MMSDYKQLDDIWTSAASYHQIDHTDIITLLDELKSENLEGCALFVKVSNKSVSSIMLTTYYIFTTFHVCSTTLLNLSCS